MYLLHIYVWIYVPKYHVLSSSTTSDISYHVILSIHVYEYIHNTYTSVVPPRKKTPQILTCKLSRAPKKRKEHANPVTKSTKSFSNLNIENIHHMLNHTYAARRICIPPLHIPTTHPQINQFIYSRPSTLVDKHIDISTSRYGHTIGTESIQMTSWRSPWYIWATYLPCRVVYTIRASVTSRHYVERACVDGVCHMVCVRVPASRVVHLSGAKIGSSNRYLSNKISQSIPTDGRTTEEFGIDNFPCPPWKFTEEIHLRDRIRVTPQYLSSRRFLDSKKAYFFKATSSNWYNQISIGVRKGRTVWRVGYLCVGDVCY